MAGFWGGAALAAALWAVSACGGPPPPVDPPNLGEAKESLSRGAYWFGRGCYREAERFFKDGEIAARLSDDVPLIIRALNGQGSAALAQGDLDWAADLLARALDAAQAQPDRPELDRILGNLGTLALRLGRNGDAENFWRAALDAGAGAQASPAAYQVNLARLYSAEGRREEFLAMADRALAAARAAAGRPVSGRGQGEINKKEKKEAEPPETLSRTETLALADALHLAGQAAVERERPAEAEKLFRAALSLDRRLEYTPGLAQDTEALGRLLLNLNRREEAAGFLDRAFYLRLALGDGAGAGRVLAELEKLLEKQNLAGYMAALKKPAGWLAADRCP